MMDTCRGRAGVLTLVAILAMTAGAALAQPAADGITFYAGFEDSVTASVAKGGAAPDLGGKTPHFQPGMRGKALLVGDGEVFPQYPGGGSIPMPEGSVEMWVRSLNWTIPCWGFHIFFRGDGDQGDVMLVYKYGHHSGHLLVYESEAGQKKQPASGDPPGRWNPEAWHQIAATWDAKRLTFYLDGKPCKPADLDAPFAMKINSFRLGDDPWAGAARGAKIPEWVATADNRKALTLMDEVYAYNRALTDEEVAWAFANGATREAGRDIPANIAPAICLMTVWPDVDAKQLAVRIHLTARAAATASVCELAMTGPDGLTGKGQIPLKGDREVKGTISSPSFPAGEFRVAAVLKDKAGQKLGEGAATLVSPGPPVWVGTRVGFSDAPPRPYIPMKELPGKPGFSCWSREVELDESGFIRSAKSAGEELLASPMQLLASVGGVKVQWQDVRLKKVSSDANRIVWEAAAKSSAGALASRITAEYDGMVRYDLTLAPEGRKTVDRLELRLPVRKECATLSCMPSGAGDNVYATLEEWAENEKKNAGQLSAEALPLQNNPWSLYTWIGTEDIGICGVVNSDEAWDRTDRKDAIRVERDGNAVTLVWALAGKEWTLPNPWKFTIGIQPTPVKPPLSRKWRYGKGPEMTPGANFHIYWTTPSLNPYFGYPASQNPQGLKDAIARYKAKGVGLVPYSLLTNFAMNAPEYAFYFGKNRTMDRGPAAQSDVGAFGKDSAVIPVALTPDYIDFLVWKNDQYVRTFGFRGLYHDLTTAYPFRVAGLGYERDGKRLPTYPVFELRELQRRIYTMLKNIEAETGEERISILHSGPFSWLMAFGDINWVGEYLKEDYRRSLKARPTLQVLSGHNTGYRSFWLPEPGATGVNRVDQPNQPDQPSRFLMGLVTLHDIEISSAYFSNPVCREFYNAVDRFGGFDRCAYLPYWRAGKAVQGQDAALLCSAYLKPEAGKGAMLCVCNTSGEARDTTLKLDAAALNAGRQPTARDLVSGQTVPVKDGAISVRVGGYEYRLVEVR